MNDAAPLNDPVIRYLERDGRPRAAVASPGSAADAYMGLGSHPDIVLRVWDQLGAGLPRKARCIFHGTPALIRPDSGVAFALCLGTQYSLRLPQGMAAEAVQRGARTTNRWSNGETLDLHAVLGPEWVFGAWLTEELEWCRRAYEHFGEQP